MSELITCTRRLEWDAGHRVLNHEGKCKHLHGHRYVADITIAAPGLDSLGRVVDFGKVKEVVGRWIDENLDHNMMLHPDDLLLKLNEKVAYTPMYGEVFAHKDPYIMPSDLANPTAENIAVLILRMSQQLLGDELQVQQVRIYETPNCYADAYASV